ncbi:MAG: pyridoxamine 5'-phosphate oxidase family protein [Pedobacter sp.]|nr:MAG: pyridoxamine 5'-phosphate oxidase family protein [Pedobacter sp.]
MLGDLNKKQLIDLLEGQVIGRLGCHADDETYIVPINYVYRDKAIYAHSGPGKKIEMMRKNPKVCFQIDSIENTFRWKSAILWGKYQELEGQERQQAMQGILQRVMTLRDKAWIPSSHAIDPALHKDLIVYKILIEEGTGRCETHED